MSLFAVPLFFFASILSASTTTTQSHVLDSSSTAQSKTLQSIIRPGSKTTYFDLLSRLFPDLQMDSNQSNSAVAHRTVPLKHISEKEDAAALEGNFEISTFEDHWITSGGSKVLLLSLDLSAEGVNEATPYEGESTLLAAFTVDPTIQLLDVVDIKTDRFTSFLEEKPVFHLNSQNDAFVITSTHFNAGENYNDITVLFLQAGKFNVVTSIFLMNTQGCGATIDQTPEFRAAPAAGRNYPNVIVRVKLTKKADTNECSRRTPGYTKYYQAVYSWNARKREYHGNSGQLKMLDKFNRQR